MKSGRDSVGATGKGIDTADLDEPWYLFESGSDRAGALDFQQAATRYVPREAAHASLANLLNAAALFEQGVPLAPDVRTALLHGVRSAARAPRR